MTHKLTGREVYDALREQSQGRAGECIAGCSTSIDGRACFDALALRLNEIIVAKQNGLSHGNHDALVRAITGED